MRRVAIIVALLFAVCCVGLTPDGLASSASAASQESVLHSFGGPDGAGPLYGVVGDAAGDIFGATVFGGTKGIGTIFQLTPGSSGYTESVIYSFRGAQDGDKPTGIIRDATGNIFGFGSIDGSGSGGTVFELSPARSGYRFRTLYSFGPSFFDGGPIGAPVLGKLGAIYGVTQFGGASRSGIVFKLTRSGHSYTFSDIYDFPGGAGGYLPQAGLTIDANGAIYGTTYYGGNVNGCLGGCGEVFRIKPTRAGYTQSVIYRFQAPSDGSNPFSRLTVDDATGDVYGTTEYGGTASHLCGTVFKLAPSPAGYTHTILYSFNGRDGCLPLGTVLLAQNGALFGTAAIGGGGCNGIGCGVVYELIPSGSRYVHKTIYDFVGPKHGAFDGAEPEGGTLIADANGAVYGTTRSGGSSTQCADGGPGGALGCGIVFKIVP